MSTRTLALSVLAASVVLSLSACDPTTPAAQSADSGTAAARTTPAPGLQTAPITSVATGNPAVTLVTPAADRTTSATPATAVGTPTKSATRPAGSPTSSATAGVSPASATPSPSGTPTLAGAAPDLTLASYNQQTGKAVLAVGADGTGTASPSAASPSAPSPSATAAATAAVRTGQLIDSPPSTAAPHGALLAITAVKQGSAGTVQVDTRPATISELLGQAWANIKTALDPHQIQVTPSIQDLKASYVPNPDGGNGSASVALKLDANDTVALPGGAKATLTGSLELDPSVVFSYQGAHGILAPEQAKVGFDLGAHANWHLTAGLTGSTGPVRIPVATLTASPTVMVGGLPVVITLNLTVYAEVSADGSVSVDVAQAVDGDWAIHADYTKASGWTSATDPITTRITPVKATFAGSADVRSGLVAEGSVALYDAVGVKATVEPYLRAAVQGTVSVDSSGAKPTVNGSGGLYGGLDVNGAVMARIAILGTPLLEKDLPFATYHNEWPILAGSYGNATPSAKPTN
ncbi:hypothetical protein ABH930_004998 [Kitasatospora sp. GAS204A]|uniref:hypothetical protein n=1 Tax=unclassified Kitasatospora TaxID=2633591 RepID=UPI002473C97F|nr:hypothetical protein [Kitasatospora sp. GAS204B]MDH6120849.1 hypothetical protein [Kitasatospora sp. GAS204B]